MILLANATAASSVTVSPNESALFNKDDIRSLSIEPKTLLLLLYFSTNSNILRRILVPLLLVNALAKFLPNKLYIAEPANLARELPIDPRANPCTVLLVRISMV